MPVRTQLSVAEIKIGGAALTSEENGDLVSVSIESRLDMAPLAVIEFADPEFVYADATKFSVGAALEVRMTETETDTFRQVFKGEIVAIEPCMDATSTPTLRIEATTKAHRFYAGSISRTFSNMKDSDIFKKLAGEHGLAMDVDPTPETYEHVSQAAQSDWEFVRERAGRIGYYAFVDNDKLYVKKPDYSVGQVVELKWGENLLLFRPRVTGAAQPSSIEVNAWDMQKKEAITAISKDAGNIPKVGLTGAHATSLPGRTTGHMARWPAASQNDAKAIADGARKALWSGIIQAEGRCYGDPRILAGAKIKIQNIGRRFSGTYVVSQARHHRGEGGSFITEFEVRGLRSDTFSDLVNGGVSAGGWEPDTRWTGVVTGIVTNLQDPLKVGRVKVFFPWLGGPSRFETNWARIAVPLAGSGQGMWFAPEVNDEVLVAFEHGDINRPYVIGFLFNGKQKPPATGVPGRMVDERMIYTRSGHKLTFRDKLGKEAIEIIDKTGRNKVTIDSVSGAIAVEGTSITIKATQNLQMEGSNVTIKAQAKLAIEAGATADIKANGPASIKGAIVNIN